MRCLPSLALLFAALSLPAHAQRGGGAHGGFSGHSASSFHGGAAGFGRSGVTARPGFGGYRSISPGARAFRGGPSYAPRLSAARPVFFSRSGGPYTDANRGFRARRNRDWNGFGYPGFLYPGYGPLIYNDLGLFLDDFDSFGDDTGWGEAAGSYPDQPFGPYADQFPQFYPDQSPEPAPYATEPGASMAYGPSYGPAMPYGPQWPQSFAAPQAAPAVAAPQEEEAVTIVFKDGRPPEQIRNYALTRTTLYVPGTRPRQIPVDEIDLPATERVNREAGIDFELPQSR